MKQLKKITAGLIAISMICSLSSCKTDEESTPVLTIQNLLEISDDETTLDDIIEIKSIELTENNIQINANLAESIFKLESYLQIVDKIETVDFYSHKSPLEVLGRDYNKLSVSETEYLIDLYQTEGLTETEKKEIETELKLQDQGYKRWIAKNGLNISYELLKNALKAAICCEKDMDIEQYEYCGIGPRNYNDKAKKLGVIEFIDPIKNEVIGTYRVEETNDTISKALEVLYNINSIKNGQNAYYKIENNCNEALEYTKLLSVSNIKIGKNEISSSSADKAEKKLLKLTKKSLRESKSE